MSLFPSHGVVRNALRNISGRNFVALAEDNYRPLDCHAFSLVGKHSRDFISRSSVTQHRGTSRVAHESSSGDQIMRMHRRGSRCIARASRCNGSDERKKKSKENEKRMKEKERERGIKKARGEGSLGGRNAVFYTATRGDGRLKEREGITEDSRNPFPFRLALPPAESRVENEVNFAESK